MPTRFPGDNLREAIASLYFLQKDIFSAEKILKNVFTNTGNG
jgi:hypothetical protein